MYFGSGLCGLCSETRLLTVEVSVWNEAVAEDTSTVMWANTLQLRDRLKTAAVTLCAFAIVH